MVDERNPYEAPAAPVIDQAADAHGELADRMQRFLAVLVNALIGIPLGIGIAWALGIYGYMFQRPPVAPPMGLVYLSSALGFLVFVVLHGYLLMKHGQTIGKRLIGTRIVGLDGKILPFGRLIGLRYLPIQVMVAIPLVGSIIGLVDALFIFRDDRRCLHDLIAGTRVVKV